MKKNYSTVDFMNKNYRDWFYKNWIGTKFRCNLDTI